MGKIGATMPSFCLNRIRPLVRVRPPSIIQSKNQTKTHDQHQEEEKEDEKIAGEGNIGNDINGGDGAKMVVIGGRKIMIVIDSSDEAKNALQWALTHIVQSQDMVILLYVSTKSSSTSPPPVDHHHHEENPIKENTILSPRVSHCLSCMKMICNQKRPEVKIEVAVVEGGKEKGRVIVEEAKKKEVGVLVIGQKKRSTTWRLVMMWAKRHNYYKVAGAGAGSGGGGVVEYCIQNASCMAIGVRRKSKKGGGYLITTKQHKDFWLLA